MTRTTIMEAMPHVIGLMLYVITPVDGDWQVISGSAEQARRAEANGHKVRTFIEITEPMPALSPSWRQVLAVWALLMWAMFMVWWLR